MSKIKVSCVSFLNSQPFVYGLKNFKDIQNEIELSLDVPSICADKLIKNEVDIGLIPIAALPHLNQYKIISNFCIGAYKKVLSVLLLSNYSLKEIKTIQLDSHSRTSNNLVKILAKYYWNINPKISLDIKKNDHGFAKISIGDKAIREAKSYRFTYDLAEEWYNFKKKKFVFACWVANKEIPEKFISTFNKALQHGIQNINQIIESETNYNIEKLDLKDYLENNIDFILDEEKKESLKLYLEYYKSLNNIT